MLWTWTDRAAGRAHALEMVPKMWRPIAMIFDGGFDLSEVYEAERDKAAPQTKVRAVMTEFAGVTALYRKSLTVIEAAVVRARRALSDAIGEVKALRPAYGKYHALPRMI